LERRKEALERLLPRYWPALESHVRRRFGLTAEDLADALQDFALDKVLIGNVLAEADRARGKFRTFLLRTLDNYVLNWMRNAAARKRRPSGGLIPLEEGPQSEPAAANAAHPEEDEAWARALLSLTAERMQRECHAGGRRDIWEVFAGRVIAPLMGNPPAAYADLAARLRVSLSACQQLLTTGKRMFRRTVKGLIAEYARDEAEAHCEMTDFKALLFGE
jgi:RNA polymerase sigma-70 factor (ECF subfamily)